MLTNGAYYNEHDSFAAAWLRNLIAAKLIADGEVDERSIEEVKPDDLRGFTQCHFFAGIGVWSYALRRAGWPDAARVWTGSCPCQSFSASGKREGFSDKRHLWPAWFRLIRECKPDICFGEQVASNDGLSWFDVVSSDMEGEGYTVGAADLCAAGFGAPHIRQRLYFVADARRGNAQQRGYSDEMLDGRHGKKRSTSAVSGSGAISTRRGVGFGSAVADSSGRASERHAGSLLGAQAQVSCQDGTRHGDLSVRPSDGRAACVVADPQYAERWQGAIGRNDDHPTQARRHEGASSTGERGKAGELGHAETNRREGQPIRANGDSQDGVTQTGITSDMAHARCPKDDEQGNSRSSEPSSDGTHNGLSGGSSSELRQTNGFWRDAEWLYCRDKKYRPVEPGTFPLAHGATNRVGRLRGYGNALNAEVAKGFVEAYLSIQREDDCK